MSELPAAVDRLLSTMGTGDWSSLSADVTEDVIYDASVPGWHFSMQGVDAVLAELGGWTDQHLWRTHEQRVTPTDKGVLVELELRGTCPGDDSHGAHEEATRNALVFELAADGRISELRLICCGDWDEETIKRIETEAPRVERALSAT